MSKFCSRSDSENRQDKHAREFPRVCGNPNCAAVHYSSYAVRRRDGDGPPQERDEFRSYPRTGIDVLRTTDQTFFDFSLVNEVENLFQNAGVSIFTSAKIVGRGGPGTEPDDPVVRAFDERRLRHATKASTVLFWVFKVGKEDPTTFNAWFLANEAALDGPFHIP